MGLNLPFSAIWWSFGPYKKKINGSGSRNYHDGTQRWCSRERFSHVVSNICWIIESECGILSVVMDWAGLLWHYHQSWRLEKTTHITNPTHRGHQPHPSVPHLHLHWTPPGMGTTNSQGSHRITTLSTAYSLCFFSWTQTVFMCMNEHHHVSENCAFRSANDRSWQCPLKHFCAWKEELLDGSIRNPITMLVVQGLITQFVMTEFLFLYPHRSVYALHSETLIWVLYLRLQGCGRGV